MVTKEEMTSFYENIIMRKALVDGVLRWYELEAVDGYVLHDKGRDWVDLDPDTMEETLKLGYTTGYATCAVDYDFTVNPRELYAVLQSEVPADQTFD